MSRQRYRFFGPTVTTYSKSSLELQSLYAGTGHDLRRSTHCYKLARRLIRTDIGRIVINDGRLFDPPGTPAETHCRMQLGRVSANRITEVL